jgi:hypothetical protein
MFYTLSSDVNLIHAPLALRKKFWEIVDVDVLGCSAALARAGYRPVADALGQG